MRKITVVMAGLAAAMLVGEASSVFAQEPPPPPVRKKVGYPKYRPLTVAPRPAPADGGLISAPVGIATGVAGGALAGAGTLITAPFTGLSGGAVGISGTPAPPLPIEARFAHSGKVKFSYDAGYAQDVPVDASGPIYKINGSTMRAVNPFTLAAFPITAATSVVTAPLRPAVPPQP